MTYHQHDCPPFETGEIRLPYARGADGRILHISAALRGAACRCTCPGCGSVVIAKQGDILAHHFAHAADTDCACAAESTAHALTKQAIIDAGGVLLPAIYLRKGPSVKSIFQRGDTIEAERTLDDLRPDLVLTVRGRVLAIEIFVKHRVSREKAATYRAMMQPVIEIDVSRIPLEKIEHGGIDAANKKWLYHPAIDIATAEQRIIDAEAAERKANEAKSRAEQAMERLRAAQEMLGGIAA